MPPRTERAGRMAPDDRRAAIVDATLPLVLQHGAAVTVRQIAAAAGIAEGTIFTVFPDKDALMAAVKAKGFDTGPALAELAAIDRRLPFRDRVLAVVEITQERLRTTIRLVMALGLAPPSPSDKGDEDRRRIGETFLDAIVDVIGDDAPLRVPPRELGHVVQMLTFSATHPLISAGHPLDAAQIVAVVLDGLLDPHHTPRPDGNPSPCSSVSSAPTCAHTPVS